LNSAGPEGGGQENPVRNLLRKAEIYAISLNRGRTEAGRRQRLGAREGDGNTLGAHLEQGETREKDFFIWIRCNLLKSHDSAKGIQGNPSLFPWIPLD
jgi:hypothetical protein